MKPKPWQLSGMLLIVMSVLFLLFFLFSSAHRVSDTGDAVMISTFLHGIIVGIIMLTLGNSLTPSKTDVQIMDGLLKKVSKKDGE